MTAAEVPDDGMFGQVSDGMLLAIVEAGLGGSGVAVYAALARYADRRTRECEPSIERLVERTGCSDKTVRRVLLAGEQAGLWSLNRRRYASKGPRSTIYRLHDHHLAHRRGAGLSDREAPVMVTGGHRSQQPEGSGHGDRQTEHLNTALEQSTQPHKAVSDGRTARRAPVAAEAIEGKRNDAGRLAEVEAAAVPVSPAERVGTTPGQDEAGAVAEAAVAGRRSGPVHLHPPTPRECGLPRREQQGRAMARLHKGLAAAGYRLLDRDAGDMPGADWRDRGGSELARVIGAAIDDHGLRRAIEAAEVWANDQIENGSPWIVPENRVAAS
ncbi:helix-turn-helix domain-containing protein [Pseudonocardia sp. NPDC049635]|uniref:helix-turn-helix domain-containing protein n=1 Tax=Pseudonocardia sp. NPDC049635 TaxID=3155506 RepID=UPI0033F687D9